MLVALVSAVLEVFKACSSCLRLARSLRARTISLKMTNTQLPKAARPSTTAAMMPPVPILPPEGLDVDDGVGAELVEEGVLDVCEEEVVEVAIVEMVEVLDIDCGADEDELEDVLLAPEDVLEEV